MSERRKLKRRHLIIYLSAYEAGTDVLLGHLVDINASGIMLMRDKPVEIGTVLKMRVNMPSDESGDSEEFIFEARCLRSEQSVNKDIYDSGFELIDANPESLEKIQNIIEELGFVD